MDRVLVSPTLVKLSSVSRCAIHCLRNTGCKSFAYKTYTQECFWSKNSSYQTWPTVNKSYDVIYDAGTAVPNTFV